MIQVHLLKAMCWEIQFFCAQINKLAPIPAELTGAGGWASLSGVTPAWGRATHRLTTTYITAFPYRVTFTLKSHTDVKTWRSERCVQTPTGAAWMAAAAEFTQAAGGWCSCAAGVPTGRSAASASSVRSSEEDREVSVHPLLLKTHTGNFYSSPSIHFAETSNCTRAQLKLILLKSWRLFCHPHFWAFWRKRRNTND